jgi:hypothetical protein
MINLGTSSSFVHYSFVKQNKIKTISLPSPIPLYNIDNSGNAVGKISTIVILDTTIRDKQKKLLFLVTNIDQEKVILGID